MKTTHKKTKIDQKRSNKTTSKSEKTLNAHQSRDRSDIVQVFGTQEGCRD